MQNTGEFKLYRYRWVVLLLIVILNIAMELNFLTFAAITGDAAKFYGVPDLWINLLSASAMLIYAIISIPIASLLNKLGLRKGIGLGAVILGVFAMLKGFWAADFPLVLFAQIILAIGQPLICNAVTRVSGVWFSAKERGTTTGIIYMSQYIGMLAAIAFTPFIVEGNGIQGMLMFYGILSAVVSVVFIIFMREKPPTPAGEEDVDVQLRTRTAVKSYFKNGSAIVVFITIFFGMGIFNSVTTCLEQILRSRSFDSETIGIFGGLIFLVGIIGAVVLGAISDKVGKRKPFIIAGSVMMIPSLLGLGFAADPTIVLVSCILFGFFMLGLGPLTFQYAAEITKPAPETISQSVLQLSGQLAGLIFVLAMGSLGDYMYTILLVFAAISVVNLVLQSRLKDSRFLINNAQAKHPEKQPTN